jgi:hypothetical protein
MHVSGRSGGACGGGGARAAGSRPAPALAPRTLAVVLVVLKDLVLLLLAIEVEPQQPHGSRRQVVHLQRRRLRGVIGAGGVGGHPRAGREARAAGAAAARAAPRAQGRRGPPIRPQCRPRRAGAIRGDAAGSWVRVVERGEVGRIELGARGACRGRYCALRFLVRAGHSRPQAERRGRRSEASGSKLRKIGLTWPASRAAGRCGRAAHLPTTQRPATAAAPEAADRRSKALEFGTPSFNRSPAPAPRRRRPCRRAPHLHAPSRRSSRRPPQHAGPAGPSAKPQAAPSPAPAPAPRQHGAIGPSRAVARADRPARPRGAEVPVNDPAIP